MHAPQAAKETNAETRFSHRGYTPPERLASERLASERLASERLASERLAPERLAPERLASERFASERLPSERLSPGHATRLHARVQTHLRDPHRAPTRRDLQHLNRTIHDLTNRIADVELLELELRAQRAPRVWGRANRVARRRTLLEGELLQYDHRRAAVASKLVNLDQTDRSGVRVTVGLAAGEPLVWGVKPRAIFSCGPRDVETGERPCQWNASVYGSVPVGHVSYTGGRDGGSGLGLNAPYSWVGDDGVFGKRAGFYLECLGGVCFGEHGEIGFDAYIPLPMPGTFFDVELYFRHPALLPIARRGVRWFEHLNNSARGLREKLVTHTDVGDVVKLAKDVGRILKRAFEQRLERRPAWARFVHRPAPQRSRRARRARACARVEARRLAVRLARGGPGSGSGSGSASVDVAPLVEKALAISQTLDHHRDLLKADAERLPADTLAARTNEAELALVADALDVLDSALEVQGASSGQLASFDRHKTDVVRVEAHTLI
ncbi:MAG: hypothetical protein IPK13_08245 [Deltaproteobacteria bacterium]|nr:hypothetical protein [Deltaproteobacteria bacterium]